VIAAEHTPASETAQRQDSRPTPGRRTCPGSFFDPSVKVRVNCAAGADTASWRTAVTVTLAHGDSR
jgi:hypothetical protein